MRHWLCRLRVLLRNCDGTNIIIDFLFLTLDKIVVHAGQDTKKNDGQFGSKDFEIENLL